MHSQESYVCIIDGLGSESDHRGMSPGYEALQALCIHPAKGVDVCSCVWQHMFGNTVFACQYALCMSVCTPRACASRQSDGEGEHTWSYTYIYRESE